MPRGIQITKQQKSEICRLTKEGYSQPEIGARVGLCKRTVSIIQKENHLRASNRWRFGEEAFDENMIRMPVAMKDEQKTTDEKPVERTEKMAKNESQKWVAVTQKAIKLTGERTKFTYELKFEDTFLTVDSGYDEPIKIDMKDLVAFGNELLAVADEISKMSLA